MTTPPSRRPPGPLPGPPGAGNIPAAPTSAHDISALDPLVTTWGPEESLWHAFNAGHGSREFYGGDPTAASTWGRFHPFVPDGVAEPLPVFYAANTLLGALAETILHDVPANPLAAKRVPYAKLRHRLAAELGPTRELKLADLRGFGTTRIGISRAELLETGPVYYPQTAPWGKALHAHPEIFDGMVWVSRQHDLSHSMVLFGDRVVAGDLQPVDDHIPLTLAGGKGLELVLAAAIQANITITGL